MKQSKVYFSRNKRSTKGLWKDEQDDGWGENIERKRMEKRTIGNIRCPTMCRA